MIDKHDYKSIVLHNQIIDIDINMIDLIKTLNKNKLITRGCCENWNNGYAYIIFEVNEYNLLLKNNKKFCDFVKNKVVKQSEIYYALNIYRDIKYKYDEYEKTYKKETENWQSISFPTNLINTLHNIID